MVPKGQIHYISNTLYEMCQLCAEYHAFIKKCTIIVYYSYCSYTHIELSMYGVL